MLIHTVHVAVCGRAKFLVVQGGQVVLDLDGTLVVVKDTDAEATVLGSLGAVVELETVLLEGLLVFHVVGLVVGGDRVVVIFSSVVVVHAGIGADIAIHLLGLV